MRRKPIQGLIALATLIAFVSLPLPAQQSRERFDHTIERTESLDYLLSLPEGYSADGDAWPLVLFLHGAGERGTDPAILLRHGPPKLIARGEKIPAIVVSPQCPPDRWWNDYADTLLALVTEIESSHNVDSDRIYVTGLSMGGFGTWELLGRAADRFAAAAPICGGGSAIFASRMTGVPLRVYHGDADLVVPLDESVRMVEAVNRRGAKDVELTIYPGVGHDSWTATYDDPAFWEWMFAQRRGQP